MYNKDMYEERNALLVGCAPEFVLNDSEILAFLGYSVTVVETGAAVLDFLASQYSSLVLIASCVQDVSLFSLARMIRKTSGLDHQPIIIGIVDNNDYDFEINRNEIDGWTSHPLDLEKIILAINLALQNKISKLAPPVVFASGIEDRAIPHLMEEFGPEGRYQALEIMRIFVKSSESLVVELRSAILKGNYTNLNLPLHSLKSNAGIVGARRLAQLCKEWGYREGKEDAKNLHEQVATSILSELEIVIEAVRKVLDD